MTAAPEPEEATIKYLILIHSNPASRAVWEGFSDAQRAKGLSEHAARIPEAAYGLVEVRPVLDLGGLEL